MHAASWSIRDAPAVAKWLEISAENASQSAYGKPACYLGTCPTNRNRPIRSISMVWSICSLAPLLCAQTSPVLSACITGEGGSIPFMGMLGKMFPEAQFLIT